MCRNHCLTSFGPLCCVQGETAEDINCPISGEFPLRLSPEERRGKDTRERRRETAGLALPPCCSSPWGQWVGLLHRKNSFRFLYAQVSAWWTWRIKYIYIKKKKTTTKKCDQKNREQQQWDDSVNLDRSVDFPDEHVGCIEANRAC